jgi:hypothetical protein
MPAVIVTGARQTGKSTPGAGARARRSALLQLKTPYRDGTTHVVMAPLEFLQRLAAPWSRVPGSMV